MTRHRLTWLLIALGTVATVGPACGGDDDGGVGGKDGGGARDGSGTGGSGGFSGTGGTGGKGGTAGKDGGTPKDSGPARIPCGDTSCNPTGTQPLCNTSTGQCVECLTNANCPFTNRTVCNPATNTCVQCVDNSTCPTNAPYCTANTCRVCTATMGCTPPQVCITMGGTSSCQLRCMSDADCANAPNNNRACNLATMMCVQCQNNTHCAGNANGPVCVGTTCRQCAVDTDCVTPGLPACYMNNCVACRDNTHCAQPTPVCVTSGGNANTCRECGNNADCASKPGLPACVTNVCRQCSPTVPCPAGNNCTNNTCVPIPEAGPPEAGRDGRGDISSDAVIDGTADGTTDVSTDGASEGGPTEGGGDTAADTGVD